MIIGSNGLPHTQPIGLTHKSNHLAFIIISLLAPSLLRNYYSSPMDFASSVLHLKLNSTILSLNSSMTTPEAGKGLHEHSSKKYFTSITKMNHTYRSLRFRNPIRMFISTFLKIRFNRNAMSNFTSSKLIHNQHYNSSLT